jgi:mannose-6-phosphate isomerase-like protein (cupin superfamily)
MAYKNKIITNPLVGQNIKFLQTAKDTQGKLLEMEASYRPYSKEPPSHYHPYQEEDFVILKGQMTVRLDGKILLLNENDTLHVPANTIHSMWNNSSSTAIINWKIQPAMDTEYFFEMPQAWLPIKNAIGECALYCRGRCSPINIHEFSDSPNRRFYSESCFIVLTPIGWLMGYRASYKRYLD